MSNGILTRQEEERLRTFRDSLAQGHPSVFRINRVHEYILIFQKPG